VVGGGAAGLIAAWRSALAGRDTLLLEANPRPGAKIRISGGGKCNVTHEGPVRELLAAFPPAQARFLRPSLHAFSNADLRELLGGEGVPTWAREDGRVFPLDRAGSARWVVEALQSVAVRAGAQLRTEVRVVGLEPAGSRIAAVRTADGLIPADQVILATGGASYPRTGTRGEALGWLGDLGLPVKPWFPALAPIPLARPRPAWEGMALRGGELRLREHEDGPVAARFRGDLLFTAAGLSGPAALELSEPVEQARRRGAAWLEYGSAEDARALESTFLAEAAERPESTFRRWLHARLPERAVGDLLRGWNLAPDRRLRTATRGERRLLVQALAGLALGEAGPVPLARGEVCAGGLELDAVDPRTLRVRGWTNLLVCGELLDVNGPVGGYNLQAAFSTGFLAGTAAGSFGPEI
jgi:hypothetical protein